MVLGLMFTSKHDHYSSHPKVIQRIRIGCINLQRKKRNVKILEELSLHLAKRLLINTYMFG